MAKENNNHLTEKKPVKTVDQTHVRGKLLKHGANCNPSTLLRDTTSLWNQYLLADDKGKKKLEEPLYEKIQQAGAIVTLENHYLIAEALSGPKYRTLVVEITNQLIAEYECKSPSEKMLAETAAWAYGRMVENSTRFSNAHCLEFVSTEKNGFFSMFSKETDRATRQFLTAINMLKCFKQPPLNVTLKTQNAFVAQNQQINAEPQEPVKEQRDVGQ